MGLAQSRITAQGQISIPVGVMRKFGLNPGETIIWGTLDGHLTIEKAGRFTLEDIQEALHLPGGIHRTDEEIREGLKAAVRTRHAGR